MAEELSDQKLSEIESEVSLLAGQPDGTVPAVVFEHLVLTAMPALLAEVRAARALERCNLPCATCLRCAEAVAAGEGRCRGVKPDGQANCGSMVGACRDYRPCIDVDRKRLGVELSNVGGLSFLVRPCPHYSGGGGPCPFDGKTHRDSRCLVVGDRCAVLRGPKEAPSHA